MRLRIEQLSQHLQQSLAPIYLISGNEPLLQMEASEMIRQACQAQGFAERLRFDFNQQFDWSEFLAATQNLSLFSEKKLIELHIGEQKLGDKGRKQLRAYAEQTATDVVLIISMAKVDSSSQKAAWFKALDNAGAVLQLWPIEKAQFPGWLQQRLRQKGLRANPDALQLLAERSEGNLLAAAQAIEKIPLLITEDQTNIDSQIMDDAITDSSRFDVFKLIDSCIAGETKRCLHMLKSLQQANTEPVFILWAISRELRLLYQLSQQTQQGKPLAELFKQQRVWPKRQPLLRNALKRQNNWQQLLRQASHIDSIIKGAETANVWDALENLSLAMAGQTLFEPAR